MASISKQSKEVQDRHRKLLAEQLKKPENAECMDCRSRNPTWASTNLGIYICIRCSGLHRQIGVHITKVKSCTMDLWDPEQILFMQSMGNGRAKEIYEAKLPPDYGKPTESEDSALVLQWIRTKYEKKKYWTTGSVDLKAVPRSIVEKAATAAPATATTGQASAKKEKKAPAIASNEQQLQQQPQGFSFSSGYATPPYGYDEFMSPSALSPNVQSPRGAPSSEPSSTSQLAVNSFDSQPGISAFSFLNVSGQPEPVAFATTDHSQPPPVTGGSVFSFVNEQPAVVTSHNNGFAPSFGEAGASAPAAGGSSFAFIGGTDDSSPSAVPEAVAASNSKKELPPDSLLVLDGADEGVKSSIGVTIREPPPIPGHFATAAVSMPPGPAVVFDPFEEGGSAATRQAQHPPIISLSEQCMMSPPQLPVPFSSPTTGASGSAPSPLPPLGENHFAAAEQAALVQQQLLAMQQQLQQQFLALQAQLQSQQQS